MDAHRTASVARVYVPNQYTVWLGTEDHERLEGYERSLEQELSSYLLEHARRHDLALLTRPEVSLEVDERLRLGEFGIQTRLVKPAQREGQAPSQGEQGHTMVYQVPPKAEKQSRTTQARRAPHRDEGDRLARRPPLRPGRPDRHPRPLARMRLRPRRPERLAKARRASPQLDRRLGGRGPRLDQRRSR